MKPAKASAMVTDALFPQTRCLACGKKRPLRLGLCPTCDAMLLPLSPSRVLPPMEIDAALCLYPYAQTARELIHQFKFHGQFDLPLRRMVPPLASALQYAGLSADLLVPVPTNLFHLYPRGYDQTFLLARSLGRELGIPVCHHALRRRLFGHSQTGLPAVDRLLNAEHQFGRGFSADKVAGKSVLLVDDVMTTGATASACAKVLRALGATRVTFCCLARTMTSSKN